MQGVVRRESASIMHADMRVRERPASHSSEQGPTPRLMAIDDTASAIMSDLSTKPDGALVSHDKSAGAASVLSFASYYLSHR